MKIRCTRCQEAKGVRPDVLRQRIIKAYGIVTQDTINRLYLTYRCLSCRTGKTYDLQLEKTDAGRAQTHKWEKNDCTVRALAIVMAIPYSQAHQIMAEQGRRAGRGVHVHRIINNLPGFTNIYDQALMPATEWAVPLQRKMTINQFIQQYKSGRYYLTIRRHAFAVINGTIHDAMKIGKGTTLKRAWKYETIKNL